MRYFTFLILFFTSLAEAADLTITSKVLLDKGSFLSQYTCDGSNISPPLHFENPPDKTASFALILSDPDAPMGDFYHWVLYNIPPNVTDLSEGIKNLPKGTVVLKNNWGKAQYNGPCPPKEMTHRYVFSLYALDTLLDLSNEADTKKLIENMEGHVLHKSQFITVYKRSS